MGRAPLAALQSLPVARIVDLPLGPCELHCPLCGNRVASLDDLPRLLGTRPERVVLRGTGPLLRKALIHARQAAAGEIVVRTHALAARTAEGSQYIARAGIHGVLVPIFSSSSAVHDRIVARPGALASSLAGLRALAMRGLSIEVEVPLLPPHIQRPEAVVELAHRAVPSLRAVRWFLPGHTLPPALAPAPWNELREGLAAALRRCRSLGVQVRLASPDGIPLCVLRDDPSLWEAYRFDPRRPLRRAPGWSLPATCAGCAVHAQCPGLPSQALSAHGDAGLLPFAKRPRVMYAQRTPGAPSLHPEHRRLTAKVETLVLRPTVHCNQDCSFCSANETSGNLWERPETMLRAIARAARRGVRRLSFGGGEPTLDRNLLHYVRAACRLGVREIELVTNGVLLDRAPRVQALRNAGLTHAFVSLHAHDEALSQALTRKVGDHARTVQAIHHLLDAGVETVINHVVTARNAPHLARFIDFVHATFGGRALASVAFVTPQYRALDDLSQMPSYTEVMPSLRRALYTAIERRQPVQIGSRQGIPPCVLGEFRAWSDVLGYAGEPAEDIPQKVRAPGCGACRYTRVCTGVWKPYADRYGTHELAPLQGPPFSDEEHSMLAQHARARPHGWPVPLDFDEVHPLLREPSHELHGETRAAFLAAQRKVRSLPVLSTVRHRPLRALLVGAGRRARQLVAAARDVPSMTFEAVVSPHAHETLPSIFGVTPGFASLTEAFEAIRPEALVVAAPPHALPAIARSALNASLPCLLPRPFAPTLAALDAIVRDNAHEHIVPAIPTLCAQGIEALRALRPITPVRFTLRFSDGPRNWHREALAPFLYDAMALAGVVVRPGSSWPRVDFIQGDSIPERVHLTLCGRDATVSVELDFTARSDELTVAYGSTAWQHDRHKDDVYLLERFSVVARTMVPPSPTLAEARETLAALTEVFDALIAAGAPFERPGAPRHARSVELR